MRKERLAVGADQPALVVTYGNTTRKQRPLERDVTVLGRAAGCDVALVSPEVAPVHCIIARVSGGWRLRDCTGRSGTRLNGQPVSEVDLSDGDVLQVGSFSFHLHLPASRATPVRGATPPPAAGPGVRRLEQSRRNLAQHALRLRRRLHLAEGALRAQEEMDQQADRLRALQREIDARRRQQEQAEAGFRAVQEAAEQELAGRRRQVEEAEVRLRAERLQLEERARRLEEGERRTEDSQRQADQAPAVAREELDRRAEELSTQSRNLSRRHLLIQEQAQELACEQEAFRREREAAAAEDQRESERLRLQVEVLEAEAADLRAHLEAQQAELEALRALEDAQAAVVELSGGGGTQALVASLRQQIRERDALLEEMKERLARRFTEPDADDFEAELNRYRLELEQDRRDLNEQLAQLQVRHAEMEEAAREAELQMARERAQIAREQAELNRLRHELSLTNNRSPRERSLQERMAAVRRLKEEIAEKRGEDTPAGTAERSRWRRLFGRTGDTPASPNPA